MLVPFPFSDQSGLKVRPVLVVSNNKFNDNSDDLIVCGITSNLIKDKYSILIDTDDLEEGKLLVSSSIKVENILKINKKLLIKKIGKINQNIFSKVLNKLNKIIN